MAVAADQPEYDAEQPGGQGYCEDADYSPRAWLIHKTGITKGAAVGHTAWARRTATHPRVLAALAAGRVSESVGRMICLWTDKLPEKFRDESDELLLTAAMAGLGLQELGALAAEMYERSRSELPDEDPVRDFEDRAVRLQTTFQGAGVLTGDLTPECAAVVGAVLDALSAPAGGEDDRTREQRYHDAARGHALVEKLKPCRMSPARRPVPGLAAPDPGRPVCPHVRSRCWRVRSLRSKARAVIPEPAQEDCPGRPPHR